MLSRSLVTLDGEDAVSTRPHLLLKPLNCLLRPFPNPVEQIDLLAQIELERTERLETHLGQLEGQPKQVAKRSRPARSA